MNRIPMTLASLGLTLATLSIAAPTSRPRATTRAVATTTRSTTQPAAAKGKTYASASRGIRFTIPEQWQRVESGLPADMADQGFIFQYAVTPSRRAAVGVKSDLPPRSDAIGSMTIKVFVTEPCEDQLRLERLVTDTRAAIKRQIADPTNFVEDRAIELNGHSGWMFRWRDPITTDAALDRAKKTGKAPPISGYFVKQKVLWVQNRTICDLGLEAIDKSFDRLLPTVEAMPLTFDSFAVNAKP